MQRPVPDLESLLAEDLCETPPEALWVPGLLLAAAGTFALAALVLDVFA
jgi:hypothetical protein